VNSNSRRNGKRSHVIYRLCEQLKAKTCKDNNFTQIEYSQTERRKQLTGNPKQTGDW